MTELYNAITISTHGMKVQVRIRVISENLANSRIRRLPHRAKIPIRARPSHSKNVMDRQIDANTVEVSKIRDDCKRPYPVKFMPDHPVPMKNGYVKMPNVNTLVEMMDMCAKRSVLTKPIRCWIKVVEW